MPFPGWFRRGNGPREIALGGAEREERTDQEVEGHGGVAGLHLGDTGLTGLEPVRQVDLRQLQHFAPLAQPAAERELELDEAGLLVREAEKLRGAADLPALALQPLPLRLIHVVATRGLSSIPAFCADGRRPQPGCDRLPIRNRPRTGNAASTHDDRVRNKTHPCGG